VRDHLERALVAVARRLEPPAQSVMRWPPLRSWLQRRARRAWGAANVPLILCYGNINRSAFAAGLVRAGRPGVRSAGFHPVENRPSPDATIACAARYGVDLTGHRSRRVTRGELRSADVILVFDLQNVARVLATSPNALRRTQLVGSLGDDRGVVIGDPHDRGDAVLDDTFARIARDFRHVEPPR
jgi:protein-tyrosine-phosphatase